MTRSDEFLTAICVQWNNRPTHEDHPRAKRWCQAWNELLANARAYLNEKPYEPPADGCICVGNWRAIVKEYEPLLDSKFQDSRGEEWTFYGIVHGSDDYYYGMSGKGGLRLLSCVGSIEGHGYMPVNDAGIAEGREGASGGEQQTAPERAISGTPTSPSAASVESRPASPPHAAADEWEQMRDRAIAAINRAPSAAAEPEKPVAWLYERKGGREVSAHRWAGTKWREPWTETPLYASPSAQPPPPDDSQLASDVAYLRAKDDPRLFDIANQLIYCWAQDGLLSKAQGERDKLRDELAETKRPLDDQMRRLNERVVELNDENLALKRAALQSAGKEST